jgi:hypothetical protein
LIAEIGREQQWLLSVKGLALKYRLAFVARSAAPGPRDPLLDRAFWFDQQRRGQRVLFSGRTGGRTLIIALEEYELLFPETRRPRIQLMLFAGREIIELYSKFLPQLINPDPEPAIKARWSRATAGTSTTLRC